jgi:hypothetical protein
LALDNKKFEPGDLVCRTKPPKRYQEMPGIVIQAENDMVLVSWSHDSKPFWTPKFYLKNIENIEQKEV